jgi:hypothetical protein
MAPREERARPPTDAWLLGDETGIGPTQIRSAPLSSASEMSLSAGSPATIRVSGSTPALFERLFAFASAAPASGLRSSS